MDFTRDSEPYKLVNDLFMGFYPGSEEDSLDAALEVDYQIAHVRQFGDLGQTVAALDGLVLHATSDRRLVDALMSTLGHHGLPDGTGYLPWIRSMQARVHEVVADPSLLPVDPPMSPRPAPRRASWFPDPAVQDVVADAVLDAHEADGRQWTEHPETSGWKRRHYYADLSQLRESTGDIGLTAPMVEIDRVLQPDPEDTRPADGGVVVLNLGARSGSVSGLAAYPERRLDQTLRDAFPDLCHWYGGFFYQGAASPVSSMEAACRSTQDPARSRVRDQLGLLLREDDETIFGVVEACGSYVLPDPPLLRRWVDRTLWRIDAYDWLAPDGDVVLD